MVCLSGEGLGTLRPVDCCQLWLCHLLFFAFLGSYLHSSKLSVSFINRGLVRIFWRCFLRGLTEGHSNSEHLLSENSIFFKSDKYAQQMSRLSTFTIRIWFICCEQIQDLEVPGYNASTIRKERSRLVLNFLSLSLFMHMRTQSMK